MKSYLAWTHAIKAYEGHGKNKFYLFLTMTLDEGLLHALTTSTPGEIIVRRRNYCEADEDAIECGVRINPEVLAFN